MKKLFTIFCSLVFGVGSLLAWPVSGSVKAQTDGKYYALYDLDEHNFSTISSHEYELSAPGESFTYEAKRVRILGFSGGDLKVAQYVNDAWSDPLFSETPPVDQYQAYGPISIDKNATKVKLYTDIGATGKKYMQNAKILMAKYLEAPSVSSLDFGTADVDVEAATKTFTIVWCNVPEMSYEITGEGAAAFSVEVANNAKEGAWNTATFSVTYAHEEGGSHDATLVITDAYNNYSKSISLHGESTKLDQTINWAPADTVNFGEAIALATATSGLEVSYEIADSAILKFENGAFVTLYAGVTEVTAKQAGNGKYNAAADVVKTITVIAPTTYGDFEAISCDTPVEFNNQTYEESFAGDVKVGLNYMGGDSIVHVAITINHATTGTDEKTITYGDDVEWNGIALKDSTVGVHSVVYVTTNAVDCDSTVTLTLTVNKQETLNVPVELSFCEGGSVEYRGVEYTEGGNYEVPAEGETRDTLYIVKVTVLQPSFGTDEMQIVYGADTAWNGIALSDSTVGVHSVVYVTTNAVGCDSTVMLTLTVTKQDVEEVPVELVFCAGDSVEYRGVFYSEAGQYPVYAEGAVRDTVYNVLVVVNEPSATSEEMTIVYGTDTAWNGIALNDSTVGVHTLVYETTNVAGCDSIVTLTLTVEKQQTVETYYPIGICPGDSAEYRGKWYYESVEDTIYAEGEICDTIIYVTVAILPTSYEILNDTVLSGYAITLPEGEWVIGEDTVSGTYPTVQSAEETVLTFYQYGHIDDGCEAIIELNVLVQSNFEAIDNIFVGEKAVKELRNGVIYIRRGGKEFTTDGQMVK